ncbi:CehA/McbA family metallohydrolase [Kineobactrum salinum]|uniref:CehA/McbA family metallohydrolase n=1 Tax=Kineobactrum salinum TaxID=2708301 RepID=A0A6C0UAD3_9GAMM|nr:CehA/McbA family metallohydrolase [Kineobactrum salinum]QIB66774.1 CehA/McbA family metallohydrolase [Kineobactrum salinum]
MSNDQLALRPRSVTSTARRGRTPMYFLYGCILACTLVATADVARGHTTGHPEGPLGKISHAWQPDPAIASVFSLNFDFHAGANVVNWTPAAEMIEVEGRDCIRSGYILFDVDDDVVFDADASINVEMEFYRPQTDGFVLSWDHAVVPHAVEHSFGEADTSSPWHRVSMTLDRARFANRKYYGSDLGIAGIGSQLHHPEGSGQVVLCDISLNIPDELNTAVADASVELRVRDEKGQPTAARVGIYRQDGWQPRVADAALELRRYTEDTRTLPLVAVPASWPEHGRYVFFADGDYKGSLPSGDYELVVMKGPEYRMVRRPFSVEPGQSTVLDVQLARWSDPRADGWLSGDVHIHIGREDANDNAGVLNFMRAEDLRVANLLQMGNLHDSYFRQYAFGEAGVHREDDYFLVSGQESPRTSHRGHSIGLNTRRFHWPQAEYFFYDRTSDAIREEGGLWGYAHVAIEAFNMHYGLALDVPRGKVDFIEMMQYGVMNTAYFYDFLNMGYRLLPAAGSDYPYIGFPGAERLYVHTPELRSAQDWFDALRQQRSYVTNWMTLELSVNGDTRSSEFAVKQNETLKVSASVSVNPDFDTMDRVELVRQGEVVARAEARGDGITELAIDHAWNAVSSGWFAVRAYGRSGALLHSAPLYVFVDGNRDFSDPEQRGPLAQKYRELLLEFRDSTPDLAEEWERHDVETEVHAAWDRAQPQLRRAIAEALREYDRLIGQ